ncbi:lysozyme inhibitor LprI family protein [Burkholderia sp. IMCC1007]|uniref:lysozyme inhibitor LprI family protein n=1 Tax=Burkholderia sp. IMCC1007 TaxID=3004104 RepID=UPI0022B3A0D7|nr:lysozyme inhibitor LprI family protein [Burkholderia sp. IMCC1007]
MTKNIAFFMLILISSTVFSKVICNGQVNAELADCAEENYEAADRILNNSYNEFIRKSNPPEKKNLIEAQRAWIEYKERYCDAAFDATAPGAEASIDKWACLTSLTEVRTNEIRYLESSIGMDDFRRSLSVMANLYENGDTAKVISKLIKSTPDRSNPDWVKYVHLNCKMTAERLQEEGNACTARLNFFKNW